MSQAQHDASISRLRRWCRLALRTLIYPGKIVVSRGQQKNLLRWVMSTTPGYLLRKPSPWITFDAIEYIDKRAAPGWRVFEYGSGGSTLYWLSKGIECVSIEHDPVWHAKLRQLFPADSGIDYRLVPPTLSDGSDWALPGSEHDPTGWADPECYRSSSPEFRQHSFRSYAAQIDEFPEGHFDAVMVDGRARPSCIWHAMPKVKPGGMLIVDNGERPHYYLRTGRHLLESFHQITFRGVCPAMPYHSQTDVFLKKPA
ncbi:hypothetical protein ACWD62_16185 [Streptomyces sp. NPDC005146]